MPNELRLVGHPNPKSRFFSKRSPILFSIIRNEFSRLRYFLQHYRSMGVEEFVFVDNDSTDGSIALLEGNSDVRVYSCKSSYGSANCGHDWLKYLLSKYGRDRWCVVADADELLIYPEWERVELRQLGKFLSSNGSNALACIQVDMYPKRFLAGDEICDGEAPHEFCSYFDAGNYTWDGVQRSAPPGYGITGGVRKRLFGVEACLSKVPFFFNSSRVGISQGAHFLEGGRFSEVQGALLHFKLTSSLPMACETEVRRAEHWRQGQEYRAYLKVLSTAQNLVLFGESSRKFDGIRSLIQAGLVHSCEQFLKLSRKR